MPLRDALDVVYSYILDEAGGEPRIRAALRTFLDTGVVEDLSDDGERFTPPADDEMSTLYRPQATPAGYVTPPEHRKNITVGTFKGKPIKVSAAQMDAFKEFGGTMQRTGPRPRLSPPKAPEQVP